MSGSVSVSSGDKSDRKPGASLFARAVEESRARERDGRR